MLLNHLGVEVVLLNAHGQNLCPLPPSVPPSTLPLFLSKSFFFLIGFLNSKSIHPMPFYALSFGAF